MNLSTWQRLKWQLFWPPSLFALLGSKSSPAPLKVGFTIGLESRRATLFFHIVSFEMVEKPRRGGVELAS